MKSLVPLLAVVSVYKERLVIITFLMACAKKYRNKQKEK
jgi:hypothetical protein